MVCLFRLLLLVASAGLLWPLLLPFPFWLVRCSCSGAFSFVAGCFAAAAFPPWPVPWPVSGASAGAFAVGLCRLPPLFANTFGLSWLMLLLSRWSMVLLLLLLFG